jgi:hypothetical protein
MKDFNLDCMSLPDLMGFWAKYQSGRCYRDLGISGKGAKRAAGDVANYAANKATAMQCRLRGDIQTAIMYESICDRIYSDLPASLRW